MKVAINGIGIAGPTLAWWLRTIRELGYQVGEVRLVELASALRDDIEPGA